MDKVNDFVGIDISKEKFDDWSTKHGNFTGENLDNMEYKNCLRLFPALEEYYSK